MKILDIYKNPLYTLYQWDVNQFVNIVGINPDMPVSVQFWRAGQSEAFVVESTVSGNIVTAAIPNELLREPGELVIYIWQDTGTGEQKGGRTETFFNIPIKERAQPSDYIYDDNVEYISVKTVIKDAQEATEAATSAAKLANDTAADIKQKADNGEFDGKDGTDGKDGAPGAQGEPGQPGADGKSATITIGTVTTVSPDTPASVTNTGTSTDAIFNFEIPKGQDGSGGGADIETLEKIAIKTTIEGNPAMSNSSAEWRVPLIEAYGQSTQGANPTPEAPQEIKSATVTGIKITDGAEQEQLISISTPITLRGIPSESGNITIDGTKYLSDYIGQKEGVYGVFRKIGFKSYNGSENWIYNPFMSGDFKVNQFYETTTSDFYHSSSTKNVISNISSPAIIGDRTSKYNIVFSVGEGIAFNISPDKDFAQDVQGWKDWLKSKNDDGEPVKIQYTLKTEAFEVLPEPDQQALKDLKTFYPSSVIYWETEDGGRVWTRAEIIHDPAKYIDEKISNAVTQAITLAQGGTT